MGGSVYWRVSRGGGRARGGGVAGKQSCLICHVFSSKTWPSAKYLKLLLLGAFKRGGRSG